MCTFIHKSLFCKVVIKRKIYGKTSESQRGKKPKQTHSRSGRDKEVSSIVCNGPESQCNVSIWKFDLDQLLGSPKIICLLFLPLPFPKNKWQRVEIFKFFSSCSANKVSSLTALIKLVPIPILLVQKLSINLQRRSKHFYLFSDNQPLTFTLSWYYLFIHREIDPTIKPEISL